MIIDRSTPFWDESLSVDERIDWLLAHMTREEKCACIGSGMPDLPRLGIPGVGVGGEAAHGVQQRNDWRPGVRAAEPTTSFPQPIGMSASWDTERMEEAGRITGIEARVIAHRHEKEEGRVGSGLCRWAPTVDTGRDPRWGRNEECYGEDPCLTGEMAGSYVLGMQGRPGEAPYGTEDGTDYLRCAATLKHFYANNEENGRGFRNSTIDPRNRRELYLETFRHVIEKGHAEAVMCAYNRINGWPGMVNPEIQSFLKDICGIAHVVSDGAGPLLLRTMQHYTGTDAESVAAGLKAGLDGFVHDTDKIAAGAEEALSLHLIEEADLDRAIRCLMRTKIRLGVYDRHRVNPYDHVGEEDLDSAEGRKASLEMAGASLVLLKNEEKLLPLPEGIRPESLALIGPWADKWEQDWYGGEPVCRTTLRQGAAKVLGTEPGRIAVDDGLDRITLMAEGRPVVVREIICTKEGGICTPQKENDAGRGSSSAEGTAAVETGTLSVLALGAEGEEPDVFVLEEFGDECCTLRLERTGKLVRFLLPGDRFPASEEGRITVDSDSVFNWFVLENLRIRSGKDGTAMIFARSRLPVEAEEVPLEGKQRHPAGETGTEPEKDGSGRKLTLFRAAEEKTGTRFTVHVVSRGADRAAALAASKEYVILAMGTSPMLPAKEDRDRKSLSLPAGQEKVIRAVTRAYGRKKAEREETAGNKWRERYGGTVLVLFANYPFAVCGEKDDPEIKSILVTPTGSQDMGTAAAEALFGLFPPAGRLPQTWYRSELDLPPMEDYDIIRGERTYQYYRGEVLFPFGFGLTYTEFRYSGMQAELVRKRPDAEESGTAGWTVQVCCDVTNTGERTSDEVAEVYVTAPECRVKRPIRTLAAFTRLHDVKPGELRHVKLEVPLERLAYYDPAAGGMVIASGRYCFAAGRSSAEKDLKLTAWVKVTEEALSGAAPAGLRIVKEDELVRDPFFFTRADQFDEAEGEEITEGLYGLAAVGAESGEGLIPAPERRAALCYRDFRIPAGTAQQEKTGERQLRALELYLCAQEGSRLDVVLNGEKAASWEGDTGANAPESVRPSRQPDGEELMAFYHSLPARYAEVVIPLSETAEDGRSGTGADEIGNPGAGAGGTGAQAGLYGCGASGIRAGEKFSMKLEWTGDIRLLRFRFL